MFLLTFWSPGSLWHLKESIHLCVQGHLWGNQQGQGSVSFSLIQWSMKVSWGWLDGAQVFAWEDELGTQLTGKGQDRALSIYFLPGPRKISDTWEALGKKICIYIYICVCVCVCVCVCIFIYIYIYILKEESQGRGHRLKVKNLEFILWSSQICSRAAWYSDFEDVGTVFLCAELYRLHCKIFITFPPPSQ